MTIFYQEYRLRIILVFGFVLFLMAIIWGNLFYIHIIRNDFYKNKTNAEIISNQRLEGERGLVFDRNGNYLVRNIKAYTFIVDTNKKYDRDKILEIFPKIFNEPRSVFEKKLSKKSNGVILKKDIPLVECSKIVNTDIGGLTKSYRTIRSYPFNELAAQVIGYTGKDNSGINGVEKYFDKTLKGVEGSRTLVKAINGHVYESLHDDKNVPIQGNDIMLTLDMNLQCILESELLQKVIDTGAINGNGIIVDPFSGEILAMATVPSMDLNDFSEFKQEYHQNRAVVDSYAPGSTFKIIALAGGLEEGLLQEENIFFCENGRYRFHGERLNDHVPYGDLTVKEILMYSSNIGISKIVQNLGSGLIFNYARKFGFGDKTGIHLPAESNGILNPLSQWSKFSGTYVSMGQEIHSSTLQTAMAYSAIANGGYLLQPQILKYITNENDVIYSSNQEVIRKVISENTSKRLIKMLEAVVEEGSGQNAKINGYKVAGKTGTSQTFVNGEFSNSDYISSFSGIFPSNNPKYICVVAINRPKTPGSHWGSATAAPIVGNVFKRIINESKNLRPFDPTKFVGFSDI